MHTVAVRGSPRVTEATITAGLRQLGVLDGGTVVVHSRLASFGWVEGGEDAVIDAVLRAVGPTGTVGMPTLSLGDFGPRRPPPPFNPRTTPAVTGRIPERFRRWPGVRRSLHPTHSMAATGRLTDELLRDHERSPTPCGPGSPWARAAERGATVLMLGVGTRHCTMFHGPESEVEPDARCFDPIPCVLTDGHGARTVPIRLHRPYRGAVSQRTRMEAVLEAAGVLRRLRIGESVVLAIDARGLWEASVQRLRTHPTTPLDRLNAQTRHGVRRAITLMRRDG
jgi:aminoglycoside 3-N-acetyltransferase